MMTPSPPTGLASASSSVSGSPPPSKSRFPLPSTVGCTISRYSSTRWRWVSPCTSRRLPATRMSPACSAFSFATSSARSPRITTELFHVGSESVEETTYFRMPFILSANPASSLRSGQACAKPSYVTRPSSMASASSTSSSLNLSPSAPRSNLNAHPPCANPSAPPGSSITPSSVTNSDTTMRPISFPPRWTSRRRCLRPGGAPKLIGRRIGERSADAFDSLRRGRRHRHADVWRRDPPLQVQRRLDHRRAGLGEERPHQREQSLGVPATLGEGADSPALDHLDEAARAQVRRRGDRTRGAHQHERIEERVVAAQHREPARRLGQHGER